MDYVTDIEGLEALYDLAPSPLALEKVARRMTPCYRAWIEAARFCILSTVGPEGTDASPRGDDGPVVQILDDTTLAMPDWRGNNRLDSLRNIVTDGRVSLMFMVPGNDNVVRINGAARLTADAGMLARFQRKEGQPRSVIVIGIEEMYFQCAKAILRSRLWSGDTVGADLPKAGAFIKEFKAGFDADGYDDTYAEQAKPRMW